MNEPKRHHWWPQVQSNHWTNRAGLIAVTRSNGTVYRVAPNNIGVESELYTRFGDNDFKDREIEKWFAKTIDGPAAKMIEHLLNTNNIRRRMLIGADPTKVNLLKELGYHVNSYVDEILLPAEVRDAMARYLAALLVRNPTYLAKLIEHHKSDADSNVNPKNRALDDMLYFFDAYAEKISKAVLIVSRRVGDAEYLYTDGGLMVEEPWRKSYGIPFDIHAPLTPELAVEVLPMPGATELGTASIMEATNRGVARFNRIILAGAKRFVFSKQDPPVKFIQKHFAKSAPKNIGYRIIDERLETFYDPSRV